ncbi:MAG: tetratricopeptide repeat protein [Cytophagaceae bacterium]
MAKTKDSKGNELLESPEALAEKLSRTEDFVKRNRNFLLYAIVGIAVGIGAFLFLRHNNEQKSLEAQNKMFSAILLFEQDSLDLALNGTPQGPGFIEIAEDYSSTKAGNLAKFYAGVSYLKKGSYQEAIDYLKDFSSNDLLLQGRAYSLIGDAYMEQKDYDNAINNYKKAANYKPTEQFTPRYLIKLALAYEFNNDYKSAAEQYGKIVDDYPKSADATEARKQQARLQALASENNE